MPSSHSLSQVEDRLATVLDGYAPLSAQTVITSDTLEVAIEDDQFPALGIFTSAYGFDIADENLGSTRSLFLLGPRIYGISITKGF